MPSSRSAAFDTQAATAALDLEYVTRDRLESQSPSWWRHIKALLDEANRICGYSRYSIDSLKLKVYVRHAADLGGIQAVLSHEVRGSTPIYLQADICRQDLVVEIEATGQA